MVSVAAKSNDMPTLEAPELPWNGSMVEQMTSMLQKL
jgi:hypothetical protein